MKKFVAILLTVFIAVSLAACGNNGNEDTSLESQTPASTDGSANFSAEEGIESNITASDASVEDSNIQDEADLETPSGNAAPQNSGTVATGDNTESSNILVAYFSRVGNTVWEDGVDAVTSASLNVVGGEFFGNAQLLAQAVQTVTNGDLFLIQTVDTYPSDYRETTNVAADEQSDNTRPALASHVDNMEQYDTIVLIYPNWWGTLPQPLVTFLEEYDFSGKLILPLCTHEGSRMGSSERAIASLCPDAVLLDGLSIRGRDAASAQSDVETWINDSGILE